ncbi:MAG: glycosyltransferase [Colwellia sp.]|nr:glycosyltransferase [Colwellia sp.]
MNYCKNKEGVLKLKNMVAYDYLQVHGGAEIVTKEILNGLNFDELITAFSNEQTLSSLGITETKVINLGKLVKSSALSMLKATWCFATFKPKQEYNTVIVSGVFAPLMVPRIKAKKIIYYCHTPPRFLYDLKKYYKETLSLPAYTFLKIFSLIYKPLYEKSLTNIDVVLANSNNVKKRLKKYLNVDAEIVYPPCDTSYKGKESKGYFLSTARVEPLKRVDMIVDAFMQMPDKELIVMSGGSQLEQLKQRAKSHPNITFTGWVTEEEKRELIAHCEATIYIPKDEDFGMSPVESIAAGKPVIGVAEGGLLETVQHSKSGLLILPCDLTPRSIQSTCCMSLPSNISQPTFNDFLNSLTNIIKNIKTI